MNQIEKLIQQHCPEGVEWKTLDSMGSFYGGLTGKSKVDFNSGNSKFITYMNVFSNIAVDTEIQDFVEIRENENQNTVALGDILFTGSSETKEECGMSSVMTKEPDEDIYLNSFCFGFRLNNKFLFLPDFLKYLFRSYPLREQIKKTSNGVTRFNISKKLFGKILIPIPPLPLQEAIVSILDKFTSLEAELEAELEARRAQYDYYRNQLLTPVKVGDKWMLNGVEVEWKELGDCITQNKGGGTPSRSKNEYWGGLIPWASVGDLSGKGLFVNKTRNQITEIGLRKSSSNLIPKGDILIAIKIIPGRMKIAKRDIAINQDIRGLSLKHFLNNKFLTYYFQTIDITGHGTIVKSITSSMLEKIKIPIVSIDEQERIVSILDKFDSLVNDISVGLPAEIKARRKQYEYYREKLLTFKKSGSVD